MWCSWVLQTGRSQSVMVYVSRSHARSLFASVRQMCPTKHKDGSRLVPRAHVSEERHAFDDKGSCRTVYYSTFKKKGVWILLQMLSIIMLFRRYIARMWFHCVKEWYETSRCPTGRFIKCCLYQFLVLFIVHIGLNIQIFCTFVRLGGKTIFNTL